MVARVTSGIELSAASAPMIGALKPWSLHAWMAVALVVIAALAIWDAQHEAAAALADFGGEQAALAKSLADTVAARAEASPKPFALSQLASTLPEIAQPGSSVVLLSDPDSESWTSLDGHIVEVPASARDLQQGWVRLSRTDAAGLGLPERTAVLGLATLAVANRTWRLAIATSAEHERDRERRAQLRLVLSVVLAAGLVLAFGGLALRNQRKELVLSRELAIADVQRRLDDRLVRADKLAALGALAIGVAHEVATPLGVIVGRTEQLLSPRSDHARLKRNVQVVLEQCDRIDRVIRGMLALARGDSPLLERVEPRSVATMATELVAHRFVTAGVTLGLEIAGDLPRVACEPRLLEQAIANLLLNACDACEPGTGHVALRVEGDSARVAFIVTDDGTGIPRDSAARVLEPFFTAKPVEKGSGLGLTIANEIIRHNRGTLTIAPGPASATRKRRGTRACVEIPAVPRSHHVPRST